MESETFRFISLIEKHPQLYNKKHKDFLRQDIRNQIWETICKEMNWDDTNKAKKKWRNLRDKFVKKRRRHGGSSSNEDEGQREFYNSLMFLDGHVNSRKVTTETLDCSFSVRTSNQHQTTTAAPTNTVISTTTANQQHYVQVSGNQIPIEHINLEYLSGVNVSEDAQCLLDISNNTNAIANHTHPPPQPQQTQQIQTQSQAQNHGQAQHQISAAQHIQQFKIEYQDQIDNSMDEKITMSQVCQQEGEEVIVQEVENATYDAQTHTLTHTSAGPIPTAIHRANATPKKIYQQVINSNGLITAHPHQILAVKRPRLEDQPELTEAITSAVDYYKQQTQICDADSAFAKYILEELREMSKKRKNEFKRMVTAWLTEDDDNALE